MVFGKMKINETRKRSFAKALSFRIVEITASSIVLSLFVAPYKAVGLAVLLEGLCFGLQYLGERIWNRIGYGKEIIYTDQNKGGSDGTI